MRALPEEDRSALEARTIVTAWRKARERLPELGLRVMTSEETERSNALVIAELPPEVGLSYYHSLLTYTLIDRPMIPPLIAEEARRRWVGVVPLLSVGPAQPFTGVQFIHARMTEFVSKGISGLICYATPRVKYARINVEAAAEWTWNADGRTPREFALSWAVRAGLRQPELFAEWAETLGPVAWDVYGSEWPLGMRRGTPGPVSELLRKGELPELGEVLWGVYPAPWGDIHSPEQLADDLQAAMRALDLAAELGEPQSSTKQVSGYINRWRRMRSLLAPDGITPRNRTAAAKQFRRYTTALRRSSGRCRSGLGWRSSRGGPAEGEWALLEELITAMGPRRRRYVRSREARRDKAPRSWISGERWKRRSSANRHFYDRGEVAHKHPIVTGIVSDDRAWHRPCCWCVRQGHSEPDTQR